MDRAHFVRHLLELVEREGLRTIGKRFFRLSNALRSSNHRRRLQLRPVPAA